MGRNCRDSVEHNLAGGKPAFPTGFLVDRFAGTADWDCPWLPTDGGRYGTLGKPAFYRWYPPFCDWACLYASMFRVIPGRSCQFPGCPSLLADTSKTKATTGRLDPIQSAHAC